MRPDDHHFEDPTVGDVEWRPPLIGARRDAPPTRMRLTRVSDRSSGSFGRCRRPDSSGVPDGLCSVPCFDIGEGISPRWARDPPSAASATQRSVGTSRLGRARDCLGIRAVQDCRRRLRGARGRRRAGLGGSRRRCRFTVEPARVTRTVPGWASPASSHSESLKRMIRTPLRACGSWPRMTRDRLPGSSLPRGARTGRAGTRCVQPES